jgi:hypothetical protein
MTGPRYHGRHAGEVLATLEDVFRSGDVTTTELRLESDHWPLDPVAPATLWTEGNERVLDLHRLLRLHGELAVFESYDLDSGVPGPGGPHRMFAWWTPDEYKAATDPNVGWRQRIFDKPGEHTHCLLTWEAIDHGTEAYQIDDAGWVTTDAYEKYVRDDVLRLRRNR